MSQRNATPKHVAIIMDGNGRWAEKHGKKRMAGHRAGAERLRDVLEVAQELGVEMLSLFAFSTENWNRPKEEVNQLMKLFLQFLEGDLKRLQEKNVQLRFIGDLTKFELKLQKRMQEAMKVSENNTGLKVIVAVNYGGRWDIVNAIQQIVHDVERGVVTPAEVTEHYLADHLSLGKLSDPDLLIRTSGEQRISNFFLWQMAYTELYFTETLWPDFNKAAFQMAIEDYVARTRRFGLTNEQLEVKK